MKVVELNVKPKQVSGRYLDQNFTVTHDRNAPPNKQWLYQVHYTKTYTYVGEGSTQTKAEQLARAEIRRLTRADELMEEAQVDRF